jgi:glyoxylase-like metal-dependent hydrolase (beta-lactamase superfamily II)
MQLNARLHAFLWNSLTANNCNSYFIDGPFKVLIDPGHDSLFEHVERGLSALNYRLSDINLVICTHSHPDHIEAVKHFAKPTLFAVHETDWRLLNGEGRAMAGMYGFDPGSIRPDFFLGEGVLSLEGLELEVLHTPGHSPGSVCLYWPEYRGLFTGDVVFNEGLGRTDLPGGNGEALKASIRRLAQREIDALWPGHGEPVEGGDAVRANFDYLSQVIFPLL